MKQMTIDEFCDRHKLDEDDREWMQLNCSSMLDVWEKFPDERFVWLATRPGILSNSEYRQFACWCVEQVWELINDERSREAFGVVKRFVRGEASEEELESAREIARAACLASDIDSALEAVHASAIISAASAAYSTASWSAYARADACIAAAKDLAELRQVDRKQPVVEQVHYLKTNFKPDFSRGGSTEV